MSRLKGILDADGLSRKEAEELESLVAVYDSTRSRNGRLEDYYEGDVMVRDIGVDILPPQANVHVDLSCDWGRKAVNSLANLVRFDGFVFGGGERDGALDRAMAESGFGSAFARNRIGMLKKGCMFATVNVEGGRPNVRFHSADNGAAVVDAAAERLRSGFVIASSAVRVPGAGQVEATQVNLHLPGRCVVLSRAPGGRWSADRVPTPLDRPMMVAMSYNPTDTKPLGSSRITGQVRDLVDDVLRLRLALVLSTAFYAIPMRALLGLPDKVFDELAKKPKWTTYINPMLLGTTDKQGRTPQLTQLPSNSPEALIRLIESDAKLFSGATGVPLNSLGIVQDNPSSAEAIAEGRKDLTDEAESLIEGQLKPAVRDLALMVMAAASNTDLDGLDEGQRSVEPTFANPAMPSIASRTDAAMKIASVDEGFASTDVFYEMVGFDQATIARIKAQKRRRQGMLMLERHAEVDDAEEDTSIVDSSV